MVTNLPIISDSLTLYLSEIRKFNLLTEDEERDYAVKFFEEKDLEAAHTLITSNLRYVVKVASEYRHYGLKMLDLIQEGNIGLMMAVRKFNPYRGVRLISYAVWWIRAYIQNYIVSAWSLVKIGTTQAQRKLFYGLRKTKEALLKLTGRDSDAFEVSSMLHVPDHEVVEMEQRLKGEVSLNEEIIEGDGLTILETIADDRMNQEEMLGEYQQEHSLKKAIAHALQGLNEKEKYIVEHRITNDDPLTLQDIADHFSISRERVRQIEERALVKLKNVLQPQLC
ncbi:RNA polymerase sigma factor RpoH [Geobacter pelophilus]|uniref:RNA polymerase sigma factor n=2 Tax=Geobacteraceae TaxID=213422 RepID=A0AAW4L263_9BACT|nr:MULTISPECIES: RNA polymerase sigma factor RpoH [Geobacteraceae]MDD2541649.1 RNA polymerase sigma factor RpoH [Desulfuromonadaceae bacterium]NTV49148.1 RNA polymerase sigma factor RpoH [Geobacteraceae bacterium]ACD93915.1 putative RNA polymerase, sigma 70 family subunit [Trichlorobacter lovleyi SZ]MBT0663590.1 RNA polymerase sigma factor RpoH [Geoanaerobacter pelophilus]NTW79351.1 RNA polymerase sigma factor RpoH [Geobacteraceae bacterium]